MLPRSLTLQPCRRIFRACINHRGEKTHIGNIDYLSSDMDFHGERDQLTQT
jgi:hypothetical protein